MIRALDFCAIVTAKETDLLESMLYKTPGYANVMV